MNIATTIQLFHLGTLQLGTTEFNILSQDILDKLGAEIDMKSHTTHTCPLCGQPSEKTP